MKKAGIVNDVIEDFEPKCFVVPAYGKKRRPVALGNIFKQSKTKERPSLKIYCPEMKSTLGLTIALTDPDAPSRDDPKWSEMCHWIGIVHASGQEDSNPTHESDLESEVVECEASLSTLSFVFL